MPRFALKSMMVLLLLCACDEGEDERTDRRVVDVVVMPASTELAVGGSAAFSARALDERGDPIDSVAIVWSSSDPSIASVDPNGRALGVAPGSARVRATANGIMGEASVTVLDGVSVSLVISGGGSGRVVSQPAGIDCRATCVSALVEGTSVVLEAMPDNGSRLISFSGCSSSGNTCSITVGSAPIEIAVVFERDGPIVTVQAAAGGSVVSSPAGIDCPSACSSLFARGTSVTLTATPDEGFEFTRFNGGPCSTNPCTFTVDNDANISPTFMALPRLTVTLEGSGAGTITADPPGLVCTADSCEGAYVNGTQVTLTPQPDAQSSFGGWSGNGACDGRPGACTIVVMGGGTSLSARFSAWRLENPFPPRLDTTVELGGLTIALGEDGEIYTSEDDLTWTTGSLPLDERIFAAAASPERAVIVSDAGTIASTNDGLTWTRELSGTAEPLRGVAHGAAVFVAVGFGGTILTSDDGSVWTPRSSGTVEDLLGVEFAGDRFFAVGYAGTILVSSDGVTWSPASSDTTQFLTDVAFDGTVFAACGAAGTIVTSLDAMSWTRQTSGTLADLSGIAFGAGRFVAVGAQPSVESIIITSPDGIDWTSFDSPLVQGTLTSVRRTSRRFVATSGDGAIITSADGLSWSIAAPPGARGPIGAADGTYLWSVTYGDGQYVAVGSNETIATSPDGIVWTIRRAGAFGVHLGTVVFGGSRFVAFNWNGAVLTSTDAISWTPAGTVQSARSATYGASTFVVIGSYHDGSAWVPTVSTSPDGLTWTARDPATTSELTALAYGGSRFVAVGDGGAVVTSPDGITWTPRNSGTGERLSTIGYGNGVFVALGSTVMLTSPDGSSWTQQPLPPFTAGTIGFGGGTFVLVANAILTSTDGVSWGLERPVFNGLSSVTYGPAGFVATGTFQTIARGP